MFHQVSAGPYKSVNYKSSNGADANVILNKRASKKSAMPLIRYRD